MSNYGAIVFVILIFTVFTSTLATCCDFSYLSRLRFAKQPSLYTMQTSVPPGFLTTKDLVLSHGFGYEQHRIKTEDGYLLRTHRILTNTTRGPPIYLQHGFLGSSDSMMLLGRRSLPFQLADAGFDVWLNDQRGNWYSREHVKYKPNTNKFWDFSFHEAGYYDLPAVINRILYVTNNTQLFYLGHSMGTTVFFVMASLRPEYNNKVKTAILLSPVATSPTFKELTSPVLRFGLVNAEGSYKLAVAGGFYEFMPRVGNFISGVKKICGPSSVQDFCLDLVGVLVGENRKNLNMSLIGDQLSYFPAGASSKTAHHFSQIYGKEFRMYDYGARENLRRYNKVIPPKYPLHKISAPLALYWGDNDVLLNSRSVNDLAEMLPNVIENHMIEDSKFNHVDFWIGENSPHLATKQIISLLKRML